jgi:hypothetical protein
LNSDEKNGKNDSFDIKSVVAQMTLGAHGLAAGTGRNNYA